MLESGDLRVASVRESRTVWLTTRYLLALTLVALLIIVGQVLVQSSLARQKTDSRTVNIAGRQRMLSQKIGKHALALHDGTSATSAHREALTAALELWRRSHFALKNGDAELGLANENSVHVRELFAELEVDFLAMAEAADAIIAHANPRAAQAEVDTILAHEAQFLTRMDEIVFVYDGEASGRVTRLRGVEIGLTVAALLILLLEALFIFRPAVRRIRSSMAALIASRRKYERLAQHDGLTGIANRRHFDDYLAKECKRAAREDFPVSVIMIDVDHFKQFNETMGHQQGDACLMAVASALDQQLRRPADLVARYGGDEFVAVLPNTDLEGARKVAIAMRTTVKELGIEHAHPQIARCLTISIGVVSRSPKRPGFSPEDLLFAADDALFKAKRVSRDRVEAVDPDDLTPSQIFAFAPAQNRAKS